MNAHKERGSEKQHSMEQCLSIEATSLEVSADRNAVSRDPVKGIRRIEINGGRKGATIRLMVNEWYRAVQLGDSYWLYVVWNPLNNPDPTPLCIQNPAKHLDHAKKEVVAARYFDVPADAIEQAAIKLTCK
jgi:hypothetical protein